MIDNVTREHVFCLDLALVPKGSFTIATIAYETYYTPCSAVNEKAAGSSKVGIFQSHPTRQQSSIN